MTFDDARAGRDVTACRTTCGDDSVGIDAELGGMLARPADGGLTVLLAFERRRLVPALHPVVGRKGHHALIGHRPGLLIKLLGAPAVPAAAEKKDNGRPMIRGFQPCGLEDIHLQLDAIHGLVGDRTIWLQLDALR